MPAVLKVSANESSPVTAAQSRRSLKAIVRCAVIDLPRVPTGFASIDVNGAESVSSFPAAGELNYFVDAFQLAEVRGTTFRRPVGKR